MAYILMIFFFFFQAEDGIRDYKVTGVQTCALPIYRRRVLRALLVQGRAGGGNPSPDGRRAARTPLRAPRRKAGGRPRRSGPQPVPLGRPSRRRHARVPDAGGGRRGRYHCAAAPHDDLEGGTGPGGRSRAAAARRRHRPAPPARHRAHRVDVRRPQPFSRSQGDGALRRSASRLPRVGRGCRQGRQGRSVMSGAAAVSMAPPAQLPETRRRRTPALIAGLSAAAVLVSGIWYLLHLGRESTDDAQVEGRAISVSARVPGQVLRVHVQDNQLVDGGDVLLELDPADYTAKVDAARADLAAARAAADGARSTLATTEKAAPANLVQAQGALTAAVFSISSAAAAVGQANADLAAAESSKSLAELNLKRARALVEANVLPAADLDLKQAEFEAASARYERERARVSAAYAGHAASSGGLALAKGRLTAAQTAPEQVASARAALALAEAKTLQADAALKLAELNLSYTTVRAARRGVVSRRSVEDGQTVSPERPLLAIVPLDDVWVVANFKEDQLAAMRAGQSATVRLDTYGGRKFSGHVESVASGTDRKSTRLNSSH